jgi:hypothetical protein
MAIGGGAAVGLGTVFIVTDWRTVTRLDPE